MSGLQTHSGGPEAQAEDVRGGSSLASIPAPPPDKRRSKTMSEAPGSVGPSRSNRSFFQLYKRGQGYYTRMGTAIGAGVLAFGLADFIYDHLNFDQNWTAGIWLKNGLPALIFAALGLGIYWVVGVNRRSCDFLIHTDGEMKKVNWTSRKEIIAATKVVIVVTLITALILFLVDYGFMRFFNWIGVLRNASI
jgi:preprotein translocase SecE subunit